VACGTGEPRAVIWLDCPDDDGESRTAKVAINLDDARDLVDQLNAVLIHFTSEEDTE
jgi:hypothetical protein